jgi:hypothetical protein
MLLFQISKPPPLPEWMLLIQPFTKDLWIAFFASSILAVVFVVMYGSLYPRAEYDSIQFVFFLIGTMVDASQPHTARLKSTTIRNKNQFNAWRKKLSVHSYLSCRRL